MCYIWPVTELSSNEEKSFFSSYFPADVFNFYMKNKDKY